MIELPGIWSLTPLGALIGVLVLQYWLMATGRLISKASHDREIAAANVRGNEWKDTALSERATKDEALAQNRVLLEGSRTTAAVLKAATPDMDFDGTFRTEGT